MFGNNMEDSVIMTQTMNRIIALGAIVLVGMVSACSMKHRTTDMPSEPAAIIEIVTFKLKPGITAQDFGSLDKEVELQHVARQPGFVSRESAASDDGEWLVIVRWRSVQDAEASMASFSAAPATQEFMSKIQAGSMNMKRYAIID